MKETRDDTTGAGRTRKTAAAAVDVATSASTRPVAELRPPPLAEVHISSRPQRLQQPQATTKRPNRRSMATEPPTAIRPAEAPRVKSRSRRDGTWKECTTRTVTSRTVRGSTTDVMPPAGELTERKNQTQAAMAPTATMTFTHPGGRARVACEKAVPADTSTMAPAAVVQAISWREAQAAIATSTAPRQASRNRMEFSGSPGWLARRTAATMLTARRRPGRGAGRRCAGRPPRRGPVPQPPSCRGGRASRAGGGPRPKPGPLPPPARPPRGPRAVPP